MTLGGSGQPILGIYGTADGDVNSIGLMVARDDRQPPTLPADVVSLTRLQPLRATVGWWQFAARPPEANLWSFSDSQPYVPENLEFCKEFLFAHAPSHIVYALPPDAKSFSAVGYCVGNPDVKFSVLIDGRTKCESGRAGVAPIALDIPLGAKTLELVADKGSFWSNHSHWLMPRLHRCRAAEIGQGKSNNPIKLTECPPLSVPVVGADVFRINQTIDPTPPPQFEHIEPCNEFLFAHAPSHLTYAIPPGAKEFTAIGYNVRSMTVKFRVFVDGRGVYESPVAGIVPIRVPLPDGAKRLDLIVDDFDGNGGDVSFWCYPRFHCPGGSS